MALSQVIDVLQTHPSARHTLNRLMRALHPDVFRTVKDPRALLEHTAAVMILEATRVMSTPTFVLYGRRQAHPRFNTWR